ncbi:MAG TPA: Gfo/Idh/MocA family oxidoreductase [Candidatus Lokiarchaeia archaeon]|nr:Gfo/Idh/MocA family oxidoreductase [Candidatus Lokiarchaeia archaeon]
MAGKKLRVGFIGVGRISTLHQLYYQDSADAELVAVCDHNKGTARKQADAWGIKVNDVYTDENELLKRDDIDAVEVLTPHSTHHEIVVAACEAGKHVSVQKVPCMSLSDYDSMQATARKADVKLKMYENFQFHAPYRKALDLIESSKIGKPVAVNIRMWQTIKALEAWSVPLNSWKWRMSEKDNFKLPTLFDDGYHKHNIVQLFLGKIDAVQAWHKGFRVYGILPIDVPGVITYKTKGNEYGTWNVSISQSLPIKSDYYGCEEMVEIHCERGIIWVNGCTGNMFVDCACGPGAPGIYWIDKHGQWNSDCTMNSNWKYSFMACTKDFIDAIKDDRPPYRSGDEARQVLQIDLAMVASLRSKSREVKVNSITDGLPKNLGEKEMNLDETASQEEEESKIEEKIDNDQPIEN